MTCKRYRAEGWLCVDLNTNADPMPKCVEAPRMSKILYITCVLFSEALTAGPQEN